MSFGDGYKYEKSMKSGDKWVEIISAEEGYTKNDGKPKVSVVVRPNGFNMRIYETFVEGDNFNLRMSQFFDCYGIEPGNFNYSTWVGAIGYVRLGEDEKGYMRVRHHYPLESTKEGPQWEGPLPERQDVYSLPPRSTPESGSVIPPSNAGPLGGGTLGGEQDDDELPF